MRRYGLLGKKLRHSYSKEIHELLGPYPYDLLEVDKRKLEGLINNKNYGGFNITIPYKEEALKHCTWLSPEAEKIGAINTIVRDKKGQIKGYNTDYQGFIYLLKKQDVNIKGKKAIILGSGGASKSVKAAFEDMGIGEVVIISRMSEENYENLSRHFDSKILVNATPVGMYPNTEESLISLKGFDRLELVLDLIYNPKLTPLLRQARRLGIKYDNGLPMLVAQAKVSSELFMRKTIPERLVRTITREMNWKKGNIVLIGMPGAGKTTLGKIMAKKLGRKFVDLDKEVKEETGLYSQEFIEQNSLDDFRDYESRLAKKWGKESGLVISCGGGIVERAENLKHISQNGTVVWVKRALDQVSTKHRPLSQTIGVERLYEMRKDRYESWSDISFVNRGGLNYSVDRLIRLLNTR